MFSLVYLLKARTHTHAHTHARMHAHKHSDYTKFTQLSDSSWVKTAALNRKQDRSTIWGKETRLSYI